MFKNFFKRVSIHKKTINCPNGNANSADKALTNNSSLNIASTDNTPIANASTTGPSKGHVSLTKKIGYSAYGILYNICRLLPVNEKQAYFVMTHDASSEGNCGVMKKLFEAKGYTCYALTRKKSDKPTFIFKSAAQLARSKYVFLDNGFIPLAFFKVRPETIVTQLWHGTGTIKKFGQDVNLGDVKKYEARCGQNLDNVIVSSDATKTLYAGCFGVSEDKVKVLGLPRTDIFFKPDFTGTSRKRLEKKYPVLKDKSLILYAPTFRDETDDENNQIARIREIIDRASALMPENVCLGLRLHPSLSKKHFDLLNNPRIIDFSGLWGLNTLLGSTDLLITDYSSIIFEYSLLKRPMIFYAYDLPKFENTDRGFYRDYRSYVPGPVVTDIDSLVNLLSRFKPGQDNHFTAVSDAFIADSFAFTDGKSAERIYEYLMSGE